MSNVSFQRDSSKVGCSCEENPDQEDFIYLCRKCGGGHILENDGWRKVLRFDEDAMHEIFLLLNS